jgi:hypothetical protein
VIPFAIIDSRLLDLARSFWDDPDDKLLKGYRRLEDIIRERTGLTEHGFRLLSKAFVGDTARLQWTGMNSGEKAGRGNLFSGAYGAHRNPRAHPELKSEHAEQLREFLLLNHLYHLEKEAEAQRGRGLACANRDNDIPYDEDLSSYVSCAYAGHCLPGNSVLRSIPSG